jgi:hypothetical protein
MWKKPSYGSPTRPQQSQSTPHTHGLPPSVWSHHSVCQTNGHISSTTQNRHHIAATDHGTFLFYAGAVGNTMLVALGTLATAQTQGTEKTMEATQQLLNNGATHPDAAVRFHKSDMILYCHSDASYLSEQKARSRVGGFFYLGNKDEPKVVTKPNGPIHIESKILKHVMAAASEAEIGALFHNGQEVVYIRQVLQEMGREQNAPTRITTDNSTADGFANQRTKIKHFKAMDMRFWWVPDRVEQGQLEIRWEAGEHNLTDYHTKHHSPAHHIKMRPIYLHCSNLVQVVIPLQGFCHLVQLRVDTDPLTVGVC